MKKYTACLYLLVLFFFCQCNEGENIEINCILPIEEVIPLMEDCRDNLIADEEAIAKNLMGTWKLVGYGCGFCGPHTQPPTAIIQLTTNKGTLVYNDEYGGDVMLDFDWRLDTIVNSLEEKATYRFKTEPAHHALNMDIFCSEFMFFDERPFDGQLMLYQKL